MTTSDQISYGRAARLRAAVAELASELADSAAGMVTTYADGYARGGDLAEQAHRIAADARELVRVAVACERTRGTSWEALAEPLGLDSRQAAHDRYSDTVKQLDEAITACWLLGDDPRTIGLPAGACDTAETARLLDRWVLERLGATDPLSHRGADDPARTHPVTSGLKPMDTLEHSSLVIAAARLVSEHYGDTADMDDPEAWAGHLAMTKSLELGLARRKIELYERMLADEAAGKPTGPPASELRELLAGVRARLAEAELEQATTAAAEEDPTLTITGKLIRSADTRHTAELVHLEAGDAWRVSWLPRRLMDKDAAAAAMSIAAAVGRIPADCDPEVYDDQFWTRVDAWAAELGITGHDAVVRASEPRQEG